MNAIRRIRCQIFDITQEEMADIAGVEQPTISRWESGTHDPSVSALKRIRAEALRRRLGWDDRWLLLAIQSSQP